MTSVFLHNASFTRASAALEYVAQLPATSSEDWYWNVWQTKQRPFNELKDGALVGLVVSWPGRRGLAYLARACNVMVGELSGWDGATKAIAKHTGMSLHSVRTEEYTAAKREGDGGKVIVWQAERLRYRGVQLPEGVTVGRNGWAVVDSADLAGWVVVEEEEILTRPGIGSGHLMDAEDKSAIERRAVDVVRTWCAENGWTDVRDVGATESFDLVGLVGGVDRRIEVKGTTGGLGAVAVTRKEVEAATGKENHLMTIVHGILLDLDDDDRITATGGTLTVYDPWLPDPSELTPISYRWQR